MNEAYVNFLTRHFGVNYNDVIAVDTQLPDKGYALFPKLDKDEFKAIANGAKDSVTASEWDAAQKVKYEIVGVWADTLGEGIGVFTSDGEGFLDKLNSFAENLAGSLTVDEKERNKIAKEQNEKALKKAADADRMRNYALLLALPRHSVPAKIRESLGLWV